MRSWTITAVLFAVGVLSGGCSGSSGAEISVDVNVRNLCQSPVSGEIETRCVDDSQCGGGFCWRADPQTCTGDDDCPGNDNLCSNGHCQQACTDDATCQVGFLCTNNLCQKRGFCRNCQTDGNCGAGESCDHGWCHKDCSADADCAASEHCSGGLCRKPRIDGTDFNICNTGSQDLTVYIDQTKLYGQSDACAFANWTWSPADQASVTLGPDDCGLNLRVEFAPSDIGDYHAYIEIYSNASNKNPMPIVVYGQAVEAACEESKDGTCEPACSFTEEDAQKLIDAKDDPGC